MENNDIFIMFTFSSFLIQPCHAASALLLSLCNSWGEFSPFITQPHLMDLTFCAGRASRMTNLLHMPLNNHPGSGRDPENVVSAATVTPLDVAFEGRRESPWEGAFLMP